MILVRSRVKNIFELADLYRNSCCETIMCKQHRWIQLDNIDAMVVVTRYIYILRNNYAKSRVCRDYLGCMHCPGCRFDNFLNEILCRIEGNKQYRQINMNQLIVFLEYILAVLNGTAFLPEEVEYVNLD